MNKERIAELRAGAERMLKLWHASGGVPVGDCSAALLEALDAIGAAYERGVREAAHACGAEDASSSGSDFFDGASMARRSCRDSILALLSSDLRTKLEAAEKDRRFEQRSERLKGELRRETIRLSNAEDVITQLRGDISRTKGALAVVEAARKRRHCMYGGRDKHPASMQPDDCIGCRIDDALSALEKDGT